MELKLSDHFTWPKLLRFALPSILMMIFSSIYGIVDGFFVSNFAGKTAFAAVNYIMPVILILITPGFMIGTGGSALIAKTMGEGDIDTARKQFPLLVWFALGLGILISVLSMLGMDAMLHALGAYGEMFEQARVYGLIIAAGIPLYVLQYMFQTFFVTAEKPKLGFLVTLGAGCLNMVLDYVFVGVLNWGVAGAALATVTGLVIGGLLPLIYFVKRRSSPLYLCNTRWDTKDILQTCGNGISELLTNVSMSLVSILYNWQLLRFIGEDGVSAYGVLMYVNMIFSAIFMGYTIGTAPILSYQFGAKNKKELKHLLRTSIVILLIFSVLMWLAAEVFGEPLAHLFVGYDDTLLRITIHAFSIYSYAFLFMGIAMYGSGFFTALNDGLDSAIISILRTLVFQTAAVILFPMFFGVEGIWWSIVVAEVAADILVFLFLKLRQKRFGY